MPHWRRPVIIKKKASHDAIFEGCTYEDLFADYPSLPPINDIIFAYQHDGEYDGDRKIVFRKNGNLYEFEDSHCSCNSWNDDGAKNAEFENPRQYNLANVEYLLRRYPQLEGRI